MTMEFCTPPIPGETHKYYGDAHNTLIHLPHYTVKTHDLDPDVLMKTKKRPTEQKTLHNLAAIGNVILLKQILLLLPDPLKAASGPHLSTGLTPLHYAAARGHLKVVECLVDDYSAVVDARDNEGETALHKAAYSGRYHIVKYLQSKNANIHQQDKDGWTALHNACARGCLPIVRLLIHHGARVDVRSKLGHTPLINAASKGHISIVEYLLDEAHANPLLKNNIGEAAYDASAASREAYICELLEKAEKKWWPTQSTPSLPHYDILNYHVTVMVTLHENQRANSLLGLSRPHFSASYLTSQDTRGPWSLYPSGVPSSKDQVEPPRSTNANWFWITDDWQIDLSDPKIDPTSGWQYARSFDVEDELWTPVAPTGGSGWVRRRRWVRVMNRHMDFARQIDSTSSAGDNGGDPNNDNDYITAAETLVSDLPGGIREVNSIQALTSELHVFEYVIQCLLGGIKDDVRQNRKEHANHLVKTYSARVDHLNAEIARLTPVSTKDDTAYSRTGETNNSLSSSQLDNDDYSNPLQQDETGSTRVFVWESDVNVKDCRRCHRRFGLLNRRHHCRRCGLIVCDRCSPSRAYLPASQTLQPPNGSMEHGHVLESQQQRVCNKCCGDLRINPAL